MTEHTIAIVSFEGALKREIKRVRKEMQKVDSLSHFHISIEAEGRLHEGEVKLTYAIGQYSGLVKGDSIQACVDEYLRRNGWETIHDPKALTYEKIPSDDSQDDDMPF